MTSCRAAGLSAAATPSTRRRCAMPPCGSSTRRSSAWAHQWFTDTTNAYRAYSREYLTHPDVRPLRDVFGGYELLAYLSIRATQLGLKACEVPVTRAYPATGKTPTKISGFKGNSDLMKVLLNALAGKYNP